MREAADGKTSGSVTDGLSLRCCPVEGVSVRQLEGPKLPHSRCNHNRHFFQATLYCNCAVLISRHDHNSMLFFSLIDTCDRVITDYGFR